MYDAQRTTHARVATHSCLLRLQRLAVINESEKITPTTLRFLDIAGLVAGASEGAGLGNKFLDNVRGCDCILHVVRCYDDQVGPLSAVSPCPRTA